MFKFHLIKNWPIEVWLLKSLLKIAFYLRLHLLIMLNSSSACLYWDYDIPYQSCSHGGMKVYGIWVVLLDPFLFGLLSKENFLNCRGCQTLLDANIPFSTTSILFIQSLLETKESNSLNSLIVLLIFRSIHSNIFLFHNFNISFK